MIIYFLKNIRSSYQAALNAQIVSTLSQALMLHQLTESEPPPAFAIAPENAGFSGDQGGLREEVVQGEVTGLWVASGGEEQGSGLLNAGSGLGVSFTRILGG